MVSAEVAVPTVHGVIFMSRFPKSSQEVFLMFKWHFLMNSKMMCPLLTYVFV